jgi:hypothetical protein
METEPVEEMAHIGSYPASIVPDRFSTALVCVHDIVTAGHNVTFTNSDTIVHDIGSAYTLRTPRNPTSREWRVPLHILQRLTDAQLGQLAHGVRLQIDTHAKPTQIRCCLEHPARQAEFMQAERQHQAGDATAEDEDVVVMR